MRALVAYYSRTGTTRKVGQRISTFLGCDVEEIHDIKNRSGIVGWIRAGRDAQRGNLTTLEKVKNDPAIYDVVVIGTPVWASTLSTPIRTYISQYKGSFRKVAFFCTQSGNKESPFNEMELLCEKKPIAILTLLRKQEVESDQYAEKIDNFVSKIKAE
jgi:flavodoxin